MIVYLNGKYLPREQAWISPEDRGFLFADGVYEVIHSYRGKLFHVDEHMRRLKNSLAGLKISYSNIPEIREAALRLIQENGLKEDATVYIQITRGTNFPRKHAFPPANTAVTVYVMAYPITPRDPERETGIPVITTPDLRWARCDIKSVALLPNVLAQQQAIDAGVTDAIFVRDSVALEGSASNFFAVIDNVVLTHPKTNVILPGITLDVVLELCRKNNIPHLEKPIYLNQLWTAQELFLSSTTMEVMPIVQVDGRSISGGKPGKVTRKLQTLFKEYVASLP
jgi:D-alanine transaminase